MDFLRAKQAGIQHDLTRSLNSQDMFIPEIVAKYGIQSQISTLAFDPVQSLLAVGTYVSQEGVPGEIHIFGQKRLHVIFKLQRKASVKYMKFCDKKLIVLDSKHDLTIISLESSSIETTYSPPGGVNAVAAEPGLDWVFLGLQNGEVIVYDLDRGVLSPFQVPYLWKERSTKATVCPVVSLQLHPKDVGTILIGFLEGAVVFSFKQNKPTLFLQFELPPGAPGADGDTATINTLRRPKLSHAIWHPTGTFILTAHEDSCMVFWDAKDGRIVQTRTIQDSHVHIPGGPVAMPSDFGSVFSVREPIYRVAWCSGENPDNTSLLIAGGNSRALHAKGLTLLELGNTPPYLTSSWEVLSEHFASPKRQRILPTPTSTGVVDFCLIPKASPHYHGANDPIAVIALLDSGELALLNYPDGQPLSPTYLLPISLTLMHPHMNLFDITLFRRQRWLGMVEKRAKPPLFIEGGSPLCKPNRMNETRIVIHTAHTDGTLRIWDASHADEIENSEAIEVDMARVLNRTENLKITGVAMSGTTAELAVGTEMGELVMLNWRTLGALGAVVGAGAGAQTEEGNQEGSIEDIKARADLTVREGLLPLFMLTDNKSPLKVLRCSDVGFVAAGHEDGQLRIIDLRGPTIIYDASLPALTKDHKRSSFRKSSSHQPQDSSPEIATSLEFGVLTLDEEEYSSILLFVGTSLGRVGTFKILPAEGGKGYRVEFSGVNSTSSLDDPVVKLIPLNSETGAFAPASQEAVMGLRNGVKVPGVCIVVTKSEVRIFKPPVAKGAHKGWSEVGQTCVAAGIVELETYGIALACVMEARVVKVLSIPGLKDVAEVPVAEYFDTARLSESKILRSGDIISPSSSTAISILSLFGKPASLPSHHAPSLPTRKDALYNPLTPPPPRPTISNLQWLSGTQYISVPDLDLLIGGPNRPKAKAQIEAERAEQAALRAQAKEAQQSERDAAAGGSGEASGSSSGSGGGLWANLQQGLNERTKQLGQMGESMDRLGETTSAFSESVARLVKEQKKKALWGGVKAKFF
ncbi:putative snare-dependent exocytosis protein [Kalaharituber pfeilii]|nr:putative snare-dependent exocytosis protein [Kalaharituber pfeilii]